MPRVPRRTRSSRRGAFQRFPGRGREWRLDRHALRQAIPRLVIALAVGGGLVAILSWGGPPLRYHLQDRVSRDLIARVGFDVIDEAATAQLREQRRQAVPNVYRSDTAPLERVTERLAAAVTAVIQANDIDALRRSSSDLWGELSGEEFAALRTVIERKGEETVRAAFEEMMAEIGRRGLIGEVRETVEMGEGRGRLIVLRDSKQQVVPLSDVLTPGTLEPWVYERVTTILGERTTAAGKSVAAWCSANVSPTLRFEPAPTQETRDQAAAITGQVTNHYDRGQTFIPRGVIIDDERFALLQAEQQAFLSRLQGLNPRYRMQAAVGHGVLVLLLFLGWGLYLKRFAPRVLETEMRLVTLGLVALALVGVAKTIVWAGWLSTLAIPAAFVAILLTIAYDERFSVVITGGLLVLVAVVAGDDFRLFAVLSAGAVTAAVASVEIRTRGKLLEVGALAGLAQLLVVAALGLLAPPGQPLFWDGLWAVGNGVVSALLVSGALPLVERPFGMATGISLLELADLTQPLLRELALRAPGTYNHSIVVATLAEEAAQSLGADGLLARVGAYYHDVGKMRKPEYFVENQTNADNRHGKLSPALSTLIITAHSRDGAELAEEYQLPTPVRHIIEQHHGNTLVEYFYRQAQRDPTSDQEPRQEHFRYPGPKPRTKEAAIVMLADTVESASRSLRDPSAGRIEDLVHELVTKRLADGQLDECNLTLAEVHKIEQALTKSLTAIYHSRISYV